MKDNQEMDKTHGWYFPVAVVQMFLDKTLSPRDFVLFGNINYLNNHLTRVGCYANNAALAESIGVNTRALQYHLRHLIDLDLVRVKYYKNKRYLTTHHMEARYKKRTAKRRRK